MNFSELSWGEKRELLAKLPKKKVVYLAADFAKAVLHKFEEQFPNDLRPRQAIEAIYNGLSPEDCRKAAYAAWATANAAANAAYAAANAAHAAVNAAYWTADAANAAAYVAHAAYWTADGANAAAYAATISPELVNEVYEASRITTPKHLYTHDIKLMIQKAWEGENTLPSIADALEDIGFDTKELRKSKFYGRSHGIFDIMT